MGLHSIQEFLKYRRQSKVRQGVHSPFLYSFIENVLRGKSSKSLTDRLNDFFDEDNVLTLTEKYPAHWEEAYGVLLKDMHQRTVIIIPQIHKSVHHTQAWNRLRNRSEVRMSIDLYKHGLLLYRGDFVEKKHYTLKYPY